MLKMYKIVNVSTNETLADHIDNLTIAYETLQILMNQFPHEKLEVQSYDKSTVKPGFGRDPDLH